KSRSRRSGVTSRKSPRRRDRRRGSPDAVTGGRGLLPGSGGEGRLGRGEPGDGHPERRAGDVVEPDRVAEGNRIRVAAVLAADADLEVGARAPALLDGEPHLAPDADRVERLERVRR